MDKDLFKQFNLYRQVIERAPAHIYWKDKEFRYLACNALQAKNAGFTSSDDIIGKTDYDIYSMQEADQHRKNDLEVINTGLPLVFEEESVDSKGKKNIYLTQKIPLLNDQGEITGLAGIAINITARKEFEEKTLFEKEEIELTLVSILDNLPGHVYWKDKNSVFQGCNLAQARSAGFNNQKSMIGKTDFEMPWAHEAKILREADLTVMQSKETVTREEASKLANSDKVSIFLSKKSPLFNKDGEVVGVLGISFDISEQKNMENALAQSQIAANAANNAKTEFLRNMEHQLRTPFSGVYVLVEELAKSESNPERKEMLEIIFQSAKEFLELLNDIINFSRNLTQMTALLAKKFDLKQLIEKVVIMQQAAVRSKKLILSSHYPSDIPTIFISDPHRIQRIILNLLSNAIRFTQQGKIAVEVKLAKRVNDKNLILQLIISDTGMGISSENQAFIYEKFYRVSPANHNKHGGAGLGLYVVKQLVDDLEGEIDVMSSIGKGTTFVCTLPLKRPLVDKILNQDSSV